MPPRVLPPDLQRARGHPHRRRRLPRGPLLGPPGHLRLPGRRDLAHPPGHQRAGPRLPPPSRDRQALRHPGPGCAVDGWSWASASDRSRRSSDLLGAPFADRGDRADDALMALRSSLSTRTPAYHGAYYRYADVVMDPCARQSAVPLWIGGRTARSLRRAVDLGDGWVPFAIRPPTSAPCWKRPEPRRPGRPGTALSGGAPERPPPRSHRRS